VTYRTNNYPPPGLDPAFYAGLTPFQQQQLWAQHEQRWATRARTNRVVGLLIVVFVLLPMLVGALVFGLQYL
jgi:hypothetical protein